MQSAHTTDAGRPSKRHQRDDSSEQPQQFDGDTGEHVHGPAPLSSSSSAIDDGNERYDPGQALINIDRRFASSSNLSRDVNGASYLPSAAGTAAYAISHDPPPSSSPCNNPSIPPPPSTAASSPSTSSSSSSSSSTVVRAVASAAASPSKKKSSKYCNFEDCSKWKQSGCFGYCLTHVKLVDPAAERAAREKAAAASARRRKTVNRRYLCRWEGCDRYFQSNCDGYCLTHVKVAGYDDDDEEGEYDECDGGGGGADGAVVPARNVARVRVRVRERLVNGFRRAILPPDLIEKWGFAGDYRSRRGSDGRKKKKKAGGGVVVAKRRIAKTEPGSNAGGRRSGAGVLDPGVGFDGAGTDGQIVGGLVTSNRNWTCRQCKFGNFEAEARCFMCQAMRPDDEDDDDDDDGRRGPANDLTAAAPPPAADGAAQYDPVRTAALIARAASSLALGAVPSPEGEGSVPEGTSKTSLAAAALGPVASDVTTERGGDAAGVGGYDFNESYYRDHDYSYLNEGIGSGGGNDDSRDADGGAG